MKTFGDWLKSKRQELHLSQTDLALKAKVTKGYISNLERNLRQPVSNELVKPGIEVVDALAEALRADIDEARLVAGYAPKRSILPEEFQEFDFSKFSKELLSDIAEYIRFKISQNFRKFNNFSEQDESKIYKTEAPVLGELKDRKRTAVEKPAEEKNGK